jgi:hypothetical protein
MGWKLKSAGIFEAKKIDELLAGGWEPFAVSEGHVWFKMRPIRVVIHQPTEGRRR